METIYPVPVFDPPSGCSDKEHCRDLFFEFIFIVIVPAGVILLVAFCLSIIMCCSCSCRRKRKASSSDNICLEKYHSIRRASQSLRDLSRKRDMPLLGDESGTMTLDRTHRARRGGNQRSGTCQSAPGTLQRDRNRSGQRSNVRDPPGYQLPPMYGSGGNDITSSSTGRLETSGAEDDLLLSRQYHF